MADKEDLDALQGLAQGKKGKTETARLRELLPAIEATFGTGVSRQVVFETLKERGFTFSFASFVSTLYYLRKERATKALSPSKLQPSSQPSAKPSQAAPVSVESSRSEQEAEDAKLVAFKKSIAHLSVVQRAKKISDYHEQEERNRMSPLVQKIHDKDKNK
jgi:hypothetical protein